MYFVAPGNAQVVRVSVVKLNKFASEKSKRKRLASNNEIYTIQELLEWVKEAQLHYNIGQLYKCTCTCTCILLLIKH